MNQNAVIARQTSIGRYDLGNGIEVKLWVESEWDPPVDIIYYQATNDGRELVPTTLLGYYHTDSPIDGIEMASVRTDDGSLVGLHRTLTSSHCPLFIMIDVESGESWPRLRDDESRSDSAVKVKWSRQYSRLKARNPGLPCAGSFEAPNKSLEATAASAEPQL